MNTTQFEARVRQVAQLKDSDEDFTTAEILAEATQALYERFAHPVSTMRHGYWLQRTTTSTVAAQQAYRMPARAIIQGLEKLEISTDSGVSFHQLSILTDGQATDYSAQSAGTPTRFSLQSDRVLLYPVPADGTSILRFSYYVRPSVLVAAVTGGIVLSAGIVSGVPTVSYTVGTLSSTGLSTSSGVLDCIHTSGSNELTLIGAAYTNVAITGFLQFAAGTDVSTIVAGDVVRLPDTTDYIPLPVELHRALADFTGATILASKGDFDKAKVLNSKAESAITRVVDMAVPRVKTRPYVFKTRNTYLRRHVGIRR